MTNYEEAPKNVSDNAIQFAVACFEMNSISELESGYCDCYADATDCDTWKIDGHEWHWAIAAALYAKKNDGSILDDGRVVI